MILCVRHVDILNGPCLWAILQVFSVDKVVHFVVCVLCVLIQKCLFL